MEAVASAERLKTSAGASARGYVGYIDIGLDNSAVWPDSQKWVDAIMMSCALSVAFRLCA